MAFDTPENRHRYEVALTQHTSLMESDGKNGLSYQRGWGGYVWRKMEDDFEHWCAGRQNKLKEQGE